MIMRACQQSDVSLGVEARVPFLDKKFLDVAMRINPQDKMCGNGKMEKHILRECFEAYLPAGVAWRQKEQSPMASVTVGLTP
ncbi:asparagine synthase-related protein [Escherichia coli]